MNALIHRGATRAKFGLLACLASLSATGSMAQTMPPPDTHIVRRTHYDGIRDDLITGGYGVAAMLSGSARPAYEDPLRPSAAELRRAVLLRPGNPANGFGTLYGPNVDPSTGKLYEDDGKLAGDEVLAFTAGPSGRSTSILLQVPVTFRPDAACLVVTATPGSQNVWADMQRAGYWGLRRGCAVAWTDKGTGAGIQDLDSGTSTTQDGTTATAAPDLRLDVLTGAPEARQFAHAKPNRLAFKWASAGWNQEADWGRAVLNAAAFALAELESRTWPGQQRLSRERITVIASGYSNGGGAVLRAAEQDHHHLLDGVVSLAPQIYIRADPDIVIDDRGRRWAGSARSSYDFLSYANLYKACAALAVADDPLASGLAFASNRCQSLAEKGLLRSQTVKAQAQEALRKLHDFGFLPDADIATAASAIGNQGVLGQASQFGQFRVHEHLCKLSFASVDRDGAPRAADPQLLAQRFARLWGGTPDGSQVALINDDDPRGPREDGRSISRSTGRNDYDMDAALCLRRLFTGEDPAAMRVRRGIDAIAASARLRGKPAIIVHGRSDEIEGPNFTSRPYAATQSRNEPSASRLRYIEVVGGMHGESRISSPGFDVRMAPVSIYQVRALEAMLAHLREGKPLPDSQVIHPVPRAGRPGQAAPTTAESLPPLQPRAIDANRISIDNGLMKIPS
ncbi:3-hydroxybutyrate oligomer hydrolase family protein [Cupriavidus necator]|uniref:3-hydroxybutyrate oligomer hydrolase family protein n=1 Tax=Cupriavidus necator TaxID=106590 RepID=UPI000A9BEBD6|nr:3-hydroxybutyrate oligomer hydrolase family protein [Cupriavidus necator]